MGSGRPLGWMGAGTSGAGWLGGGTVAATSAAGGVKAGGKDNGKPGLRADYSPKYYAAFLTDPDGNNVEAVCLT